MGINPRLLVSATKIKTKQLIQLVNERNGILYPAHVDRKSYSLLRQIGFIPDDLKFPAVEISPNTNKNEVINQLPLLADYKFIQSSDAHFPENIGTSYTMFYLKEPTIFEIKKALLEQEGRVSSQELMVKNSSSFNIS